MRRFLFVSTIIWSNISCIRHQIFIKLAISHFPFPYILQKQLARGHRLFQSFLLNYLFIIFRRIRQHSWSVWSKNFRSCHLGNSTTSYSNVFRQWQFHPENATTHPWGIYLFIFFICLCFLIVYIFFVCFL